MPTSTQGSAYEKIAIFPPTIENNQEEKITNRK